MRIPLLILFICYCFASPIATAQTLEWKYEHTFAGFGESFVSTDSSGNVYFAGFYDGTNHGTGPFGSLVCKHAPDGTLLWTDSLKVVIKGATTDSEGNTYITGHCGSSVTIQNTTYTSTGSINLCIVKYNTSGIVQWVSLSPGALGYDIKVSGNALYVCGQVYGSATIGSNTIGHGRFVARFDLNGSCIWANGYYCNGRRMRMDVGASSIYIAEVVAVGPTNIGNTSTQNGSDYLYVLRYDTSGNYKWIWTSGNNYALGGIAADQHDNCYFTGLFSGTQTFGSTTISSPQTNPYDAAVFVAKMDSSMQFQWAVQDNDSCSDTGIEVDKNGNIYTAGLYGKTVQNCGSRVGKYNSSGSLEWTVTIPENDNAYAPKANIINADNKGNIYVSPRNTYFYIAKIKDNDITSISEEPGRTASLAVFPNPTGDEVNICYTSNDKEKLTISIRNNLGQTVFTKSYSSFCGELKETIDMSRQAKGIYFLEVLNGKERNVKKLVVQ